MKSVMINGAESTVRSDNVPRVVDLIELIKANIDPDHMITRILLDGRELEEKEWFANPGQFGTSIFEIETGTPADYVADRLGKAADVVRACFMDFRDARKFFQSGDMTAGNKKLVVAVNTLKAFFEWYGSLLELVPVIDRTKFDITPQVLELSESCKKICQQQLYSSWWALGETLEKELEPKLDKLEDFCRVSTKHLAAA